MTDLRRLAGIAGIVFVVIAVVCFLLPGAPPAIDDPDADLVEYLEDGRARILWAQWLTFISLIPAAYFIAYFTSELRRTEGTPSVLTVSALISVIVGGVFASLIAATFATAAFEAKHTLTEGSARLLWDFSALGTDAQLASLGAYGLFSGAAIVRSGAGLPKWAGWVGLVAGVLGVASSASLATSGTFAPFGGWMILGFVGFFVYSLVVSALFLRPAKA